jgi:hypothetical protein
MQITFSLTAEELEFCIISSLQSVSESERKAEDFSVSLASHLVTKASPAIKEAMGNRLTWMDDQDPNNILCATELNMEAEIKRKFGALFEKFCEDRLENIGASLEPVREVLLAFCMESAFRQLDLAIEEVAQDTHVCAEWKVIKREGKKNQS